MTQDVKDIVYGPSEEFFCYFNVKMIIVVYKTNHYEYSYFFCKDEMNATKTAIKIFNVQNFANMPIPKTLQLI